MCVALWLLPCQYHNTFSRWLMKIGSQASHIRCLRLRCCWRDNDVCECVRVCVGGSIHPYHVHGIRANHPLIPIEINWFRFNRKILCLCFWILLLIFASYSHIDSLTHSTSRSLYEIYLLFFCCCVIDIMFTNNPYDSFIHSFSFVGI